MMHNKKTIFSWDGIIQYGGLIFAIFIIGVLYSYFIRPKANELEITSRLSANQEQGEVASPRRSIFIIIKDYEQQICLTLMVWAIIILAYKFFLISQENKLLAYNFISLERGERIIPQDALKYYHEIETLLKDDSPVKGYRFLPDVIRYALHRFHSTHSIQAVSQAIKERLDMAAEQLDSNLSLLRYIAWAIPSVGFIGTVRGIGEALGKADQAIEGDISGVTAALGLAFNSTLIALFLSIVLMFFVYMLQSRQESLILNIETYCREKLLAVVKTLT